MVHTMYYTFLSFPELDIVTYYYYSVLLLGSSMLNKYKIIALFVLIYTASISHWPTNGDSLYRRMEILFVDRPCPLQFPGLFPFFVYFLFLCSFFSLFFTFVFARASRGLYDPLERSMFPLRDTRVTPFSRTALDHKGR